MTKQEIQSQLFTLRMEKINLNKRRNTFIKQEKMKEAKEIQTQIVKITKKISDLSGKLYKMMS